MAYKHTVKARVSLRTAENDRIPAGTHGLAEMHQPTRTALVTFDNDEELLCGFDRLAPVEYCWRPAPGRLELCECNPDGTAYGPVDPGLFKADAELVVSALTHLSKAAFSPIPLGGWSE